MSESSLVLVQSLDSEIERVESSVALVHRVMSGIMKEGHHYGTIPGTKKPTLLQPGAELLAMTFKLRPRTKVKSTSLTGDHREYLATCKLTSDDGTVLGESTASCSTLESRYRYRSGGIVCPDCAGPLRREKKGDGFYCWAKTGGCGLSGISKDDPRITSQKVGRIENPDIADVWNTVLRMAAKRAFVGAIKTATAASDVFTMDLEDFSETPARQSRDDEPREAPAPSSGPPSSWTPRVDAKPAESAPRSEVKAKPAVIAQEGKSPKNPKFEAWEEYWAWVKMGYGTSASDGATISTDTAVDWLAGVAKDLGWLEGPVLRVIAVELGLRLEEVPLLTGDGEYLLQRIYFALKKFNPNEIMKRYDESEAEKNGSVDPPAETLDAMSGALRSFAEIKWTADEEGEGEEKKLELAAWEALRAALVVTVGMDLPKRSDESLAKLTDKSRNGGRDDGSVRDLVIRRLGGVAGGMILHDIPEYIVPTLLKVLATFPAAKLAGDIGGDQVGIDDLSVNDGAGEANYAGSEG